MFFCPKLRSGPSVLTVLGTVIVFNSLSFGVPGSFSPQEDRDVTFYIVKLPEACAGLFFFFLFLSTESFGEMKRQHLLGLYSPQ